MGSMLTRARPPITEPRVRKIYATLIYASILSIALAEILHSSGAVPTDVVAGQRDKASIQREDDPACSSPEMRFTRTLVGELADRKRFRFPFHTWKATDGVAVNSMTQERGSTRAAKRAFNEMLAEATQVTEKGAKMGPDGRPRGLRAVVYLPSGDASRPAAAVLWTDGSTLHVVESYSLRHALAFEKQFYCTKLVPSNSRRLDNQKRQ